MFLLSKLKESLSELSSVLIHLLMITAVTLYTLFGAYVMRSIENTEINRLNDQNGDVSAVQNRVFTKRETEKDIDDSSKVVLNGIELNYVSPGLRKCVREAVAKLMEVTQCGDGNIDPYIIIGIDDCYRYAKIDVKSVGNKELSTTNPISTIKPEENNKEQEAWTFANSVVFAFTVITTIGYGNVAPVTFEGRLFCIFYGLIGVPLTLLTIADIGMFLNKIIKRLVEYEYQFWKSIKSSFHSRFSTFEKTMDIKNNNTSTSRSTNSLHELNGASEKSKIMKEEKEDEENYDESEKNMPQKSTPEAVTLGIIFLSYLIIGAFIISWYEPDMDVFKAFYFNFVTLTTIGLGDITPQRYKFLVVTFLYITIGLSLTTMVIEIAAEYLRKLHYFGRAIESVGKVEVWFGGKKLRLRNLLKHLGDQFNIPEEDLKGLDIDTFVNDAIKVTEGEIKSLRKPKSPVVILRKESAPLSYRDLRKSQDPSTLQFADESISDKFGDPSLQDTGRNFSSSKNY